MEKREPKEGQTWMLDGHTPVTITGLAVELKTGTIHYVRFRKPDGVVKDFKVRLFLSRAVYLSG